MSENKEKIISNVKKAGKSLTKVLIDPAKKLRVKIIQETAPLDYIKNRRAKIKKSKDINKVKTFFIDTGLASLLYGAKGLGIASFTALQMIGWIMTRLVDNPILRGLEKEIADMEIGKNKAGNDKKFSSLIKKNPAIATYLLYILTMASVLGGARVYDNLSEKNNKKDNQNNKKETKIKTINPNDADYIKKVMKEYWDEIAIGLTELETYRVKPKVHPGEKRSTNGLGCTWTYIKNKDGKITQKANGKNTKVNDKEENYNQVKLHLEFETLPFLKKAVLGKDNITGQHCVAIVLAGYQLPRRMKKIANNIQSAKNSIQVADAFSDVSDVPEKWRIGTLKRMWICAAYAVGAINSDDIKDMYRDSFTNLDINSIYRKGHFLLDKETVKFVLSRTSKYNKVSEFLGDFSGGKKILNAIEKSKKTLDLNLESYGNIGSSMALLNKADLEYKSGNFENAVELLNQAINQDPDNMEAYSSLALAFKKLGDKNKSTDYYEKSAGVVVICNARMNSNKELLFDYDIKASSYFNAGNARLAMADIYKSDGKYDLAIDNYRLALTNYNNAIYNCEKSDSDDSKYKILIYKTESGNIKKILTSLEKKNYFKSGNLKIKSKKNNNKNGNGRQYE